jgi:hypothetical protein
MVNTEVGPGDSVGRVAATVVAHRGEDTTLHGDPIAVLGVPYLGDRRDVAGSLGDP